MISTTVNVSGMSCGHCAQSVTQELRRLAGVAGVEVDVATGRVTISSAGAMPNEDIRVAVEEAGYQLLD